MAVPVVASSTSTAGGSTSTLTLTKPSGVTAGDLLIAICGSEAGASGYTTPPTGWTLVNHAASTTPSVTAFFRIADGSEAATTDFTQALTRDSWGAYLRITGAASSSPIHKVGADYAQANQTHDIPGVTTEFDDCLVFAVGCVANVSGITFSITSPDGSVSWATTSLSSGGGSPCVGFYATKSQETAGATGNARENVFAPDNVTLAGFTFAIQPVPPTVEGTAEITAGEAPDLVASGAPVVSGTGALDVAEAPIVGGLEGSFGAIVAGEAPAVEASGAPVVTGAGAIDVGEAPDVFATIESEGAIVAGEAPAVAASGSPIVTGTGALSVGEAPDIDAGGYRLVELALVADLDIYAREATHVIARNVETGEELNLGEGPTITSVAIPDGVYALRVEVDGRFWRRARYAQEWTVTIAGGEAVLPLPEVVKLAATQVESEVLVTWQLGSLTGLAKPEDFAIWVGETSPVSTAGEPAATVTATGEGGYLAELVASSSLLYVAVAARKGDDVGPVAEAAVTIPGAALSSPAAASARIPDGGWTPEE